MRRKPLPGDPLPRELWCEVFARLPVKALLKIRCVCKAWCSVIDDPVFVSMHLTRYKNNRDCTHLLSAEGTYWGEVQWMIRSSDKFRKTMELDEKFDYNVRGYVNGVVLLICSSYGRDWRDKAIILWNPSIRKCFKLPLSPFAGEGVFRAGIGFDSLRYDYKVVVIFYPSLLTGNEVSPLVDVYSLRSDCWRRTTRSAPSLCCYGCQVFLEGSIHWLGSKLSNDSSSRSGIISFDVSSDVFNCIKLPDGVRYCHVEEISRTLIVLDGCLALLESFANPGCIWVMTEYGVAESWTKKFTINFWLYKSLYLKESGELLFRGKDKGVKSYNIRSQQMKYLSKTCRKVIYFVGAYMESLALHRGADGQLLKSR
ncbi:hypothetical protein Ancab_023768 [Ancistrocladus abbreviatus]